MFFTQRLPSRHAPRCVPVWARGVLSGARSHSSSVAAPTGWGLGAGGWGQREAVLALSTRCFSEEKHQEAFPQGPAKQRLNK